MERVLLRHLTGARATELDAFPLDACVIITLGRDPEASVRFDVNTEALVSRYHARIVRIGATGRRFVLQDLNARNGTFLNRRRVIGELPLVAGDVVRLGAGGPALAFDLESSPAIR